MEEDKKDIFNGRILMTEKQYKLNKWATRLLKNNRPLFDWFNDSDEIVDLLNELHEENEQLKKQLAEREKMLDVRDKIIGDVSKALNGRLEE